MNTTQRLTEQNRLRGWRDCEHAGLRHQLSRPEPVMKVYGPLAPVEERSTIRHCNRCPVSFLNVRR